MCNRCDETKSALEHAVVVALKFARITKIAMTVAFIGDALVIHPARNRFPGDTLVAFVLDSSTAEDLKRQLAVFMAQRSTQTHESVDDAFTAVQPIDANAN
jgi:L-aminopeptidase/D-esterase-like protein